MCKVTTLQSVVAICLAKEEIFCFLFVMWTHVTTWSEGLVTFLVISLITSHYPAKFGDHRPCGRWDILFLVCHVTTRDLVVREIIMASHGMMGEFPLSWVTILQSLMIIDLVHEKILSFHFITWPHVTTLSEVNVKSWVYSSHHKSLPCQVW